MDWIVAVALAGDDRNLLIESSGDLRDLRRVRLRPYLRGLVQGLDVRGKKLGVDYKIQFRQRQEISLPGSAFANPMHPVLVPFVIFCMSTTVVRAAATAFPPPSIQPIVGVVSEPHIETVTVGGAIFDTLANLCGVSAQRSATADECFRRFFRTVPTLTEVKVLHKPGYNPSETALRQVQAAASGGPVTITPLNIASVADIRTALDGLAVGLTSAPPTVGIQVLPVDVSLGFAQDIIDIAQGEKKLPTFFPVPDWVKSGNSSALGAYGVSQHRCGVLMAERVATIWAAGDHVPAGPAGSQWVTATIDDFEFLVSAAVAEQLNIPFNPSIPYV